jgi:hypothetical protein
VSELSVPAVSGLSTIELPRGRIAIVMVKVLGPKSARRFAKEAADMIGVAVVEKSSP